ncbi:sensor histidine kinase [Mumia sp. Pv 4-285]|uniref:sensor histidine kinase n=1 Tax=Mumia qirimensis TaxID=3234852 RepID=UPI00351CDFAD
MSPRTPLRHRRLAISPRLVVLGVLVMAYAWALVFPLRLSDPPSTVLAVVYVIGLACYAVALAMVLRASVSPYQSRATRALLVGTLAVVTLGLWPPGFAWAEPGQAAWVWIAGFAIGASVLADVRAGLTSGVALVAASAIGAGVFGGSVVEYVAVTIGCAAALWLMGVVLVWLLDLLWAAEAGRDAEAGLVLAQERLRLSRELHDVLGHRLGIIALKAELAADLAATDPQRAAAESSEIRAIAAATLVEARRAVHGETVADLPAQLESATLVLASAGIETSVDVDTAQVPAAQSRLLASVVREAVTNILRHSDARTVSFAFHPAGSCPTLVIVNDGGGPPRPGGNGAAASSGTGLASLAARCAASRARLRSGPTPEGGFELRVELRPDGTSAP